MANEPLRAADQPVEWHVNFAQRWHLHVYADGRLLACPDGFTYSITDANGDVSGAVNLTRRSDQ